MEPAINLDRSYRKRKQHPSNSNPLTGVLTRGKSRKYFHYCTRSGKIRSHPVGKSQPPSIPPGTPRFDTGAPIKDLRAHRVFSQPLVAVKVENPNFDCEFRQVRNPNLDGLVKCDLDVEFKANEAFVERNPNLSNVNSNFEERFEFKDEGLNVGNPNFEERFDLEVECNGEGTNEKHSNLLEKNDSVDDYKGEGSDCRNHTLTVNFDKEVDCNVEGLNEQNCNLLGIYEPVVGSVCEESAGRNPSLLENFDKEVDCEVEGLNEQSLNVLGKCDSVEGGKEEKFEVGLACKGSIPDDMSPNISVKNSNGRKSESSEGLVEVNVQTTPPDVVISLNPTDDCNVVAKENVASSLPHNQVSPVEDGSAEGKKTDSILKKTSVLKPCLRPRVFRATNSFSYRRLLPYLMELAKDTSSPLKLDDFAKSDNSDIIKPVVSNSPDSLSVSHETDGRQITTVPVGEVPEVSTGTNSKEEKEISLDPHLNAGTLNVSLQNPVDHSHDDGQAHSVSSENQNVTHVSNGSPEDGALNGEPILSENHKTLEDAKPVIESHAAALSEICEGSPKAAQENAIVESPFHLSLHSVEECRSLQMECKTKENSISVLHMSTNVEGFVSSSGPIVSRAKGILKKNPRGCRGICDCLTCALFRVNAEKAFEFSRNQLLDAEELIQDMMKEVASLRCLLEKSASETESAGTIPVNQVQEACSRASDMESVARRRLRQMNEDLYVHCRTKPLHRPRVSFSADIKQVEEGSKQTQKTPMCRGRSRRARAGLA